MIQITEVTSPIMTAMADILLEPTNNTHPKTQKELHYIQVE